MVPFARNSTSTAELDSDNHIPTLPVSISMPHPHTQFADPSEPISASLRAIKGSRITKRKDSSNKEKRRSWWDLIDFTGLPKFLSGAKLDEGGKVPDNESIVDCDTPLASTESFHEDAVLEEQDSIHEEAFNDCFLDYDDPRLRDWSHEEVWLFNKLNSRGSEPLLHSDWTLDFPTFPDILFTSQSEEAFIGNHSVSPANAARAFAKLMSAGSYLRAQLVTGTVPEKPLLREISSYYRWTLMDGKLQHKPFIPVVAIIAAKPDEPIESAFRRIARELHSLGSQYRAKWYVPKDFKKDESQQYSRKPPTLYGFLLKNTVMAIVTCDASVPEKPVRTLGTFDWQSSGHDVWHSLAVAITLVRARDYLVELDGDGELGPELNESESDPDA